MGFVRRDLLAFGRGGLHFPGGIPHELDDDAKMDEWRIDGFR